MTSIGRNPELQIFNRPATSSDELKKTLGTPTQALSAKGTEARKASMSSPDASTLTSEATKSLSSMLFGKTDSRQTQTKFQVLIHHLSNALGTLKQGVTQAKNSMDSWSQKSLTSFNQEANKVMQNVQKAFNAVAKSSSADLSKIEDSELKEAVADTLKSLKKGENNEVTIKGQTYVIMKDKGGEVDVLAKKNQISEGKTCLVFIADSLMSGKRQILKYSRPEVEDAKQDFENEARLLGILNAKGSMKGIQGKAALSRSPNGELVSKGDFYSDGDYQKHVSATKMAGFLGIKEPLSTHDESSIKKIIEAKTNALADKIIVIAKQRKDLENELALTTDPNKAGQLRNQIRDKNSKIGKLISAMGKQVNPLVKQAFGSEVHDKFRQDTQAVENFIKTSSDESAIRDRVSALYSDPILKTAQKNQKIAPFPLTTRMSMAGDLVSGLQTLLDSGIRHGDIKPLNFFTDGKTAVIADFGGCLSKSDAHEIEEDGEKVPLELQGTVGYSVGDYGLALNHLSGADQKEQWAAVGKTSDIRQMGIALFEMLGGGDVLSLPDEREQEAAFYDPQTYTDMRDKLVQEGVPQSIAQIVSDMAKPIKLADPLNPPDPFPTSVSDSQLSELATLLKTAAKLS